MSEPDPNVSNETHDAEVEDETVHSGADREPTPEEEAAADAAGPLDPSVAEAYKEQAERGANVEGEGRI
jgi:hypothetical protein